MQSYHHVWLSAHPERTEDWLAARLAEGFHVHHVDGDHANDAPSNLILIDGIDHIRLHAGSLKAGIKSWRFNMGRKGAAALAAKRAPMQAPVEAVAPEQSGYRPVLSAEQISLGASILASGGSVRDAAQAIEDGSLDWRTRLKAIKRKVVAA